MKGKYYQELHILSDEGNIFDTDMNYVIPLYQRPFAWGDKQLEQLVEDIADVQDDVNYYIGSLIVSVQNYQYEVVDGQQRLTSLYLLLNCLGLEVKQTLTFACREKSNFTLANISKLMNGSLNSLEMNEVQESIAEGIKILDQKLHKPDFEYDSFINKLKRVVVYRIEVPEHTDLNRYFEIMNTRGEQLEQHDILKAKLMSYLPKKDHSIFSVIWNACSDMTGYVQMHFCPSDRKFIFKEGWDSMPSEKWMDYESLKSVAEDKVKSIDSDEHDIQDGVTESEKTEKNCILDIIGREYIQDEETKLDEDRVRFESIIDFPHFLLHALKVLVNTKKNVEKVIPLDDSKLFDTFDDGDIRRAFPSDEDFSREFIVCLLKTRYLFDKYFIKREFGSDSSEGKWSLKHLCVSDNKPYYSNTIDDDKAVLMIQSALRVSYTSPKVMHWITKLLNWLMVNYNNDGIVVSGFLAEAEGIAQDAVRDNFFKECDDGVYDKGVNTPHIVFNYLDYLIWKKDKGRYADFDFEFRNSVEHWYPQHPSEGTFDKWEEGVDTFGNLCIVQRNINSRFSNMAPSAKKSTFLKTVESGSLKLRLMADMTESADSRTDNVYWKEVACREHEEKMIDLLKEAVCPVF